MNVSGIIVTKGNVDLAPCFETWSEEWERIVWDNGRREVSILHEHPWAGWKPRFAPFTDASERPPITDLSVYGRYAAIEYASGDLIFVQDDDVIVRDPQAIVDRWYDALGREWDAGLESGIVANMPPEFRPHYPDAALVGFGAVFHRDAPARAFERYARFYAHRASINADVPVDLDLTNPMILRECDRVFTVLTPRVLVDVPKQDREFASDPDRLWKQEGHFAATQRMLRLARAVRDA